MAFELVVSASVVVARPAQVVGLVVSFAAGHPPSAAAEHHAPEQVGPSRFGMGVRVVDVAGATLGFPSSGHFIEHPFRDQRLVCGVGRPHPFDRVVDLAPFRARRTPVENLKTGVFRVAQNFIHACFSPRAACSLFTGRHRRRILLRVGVETFSDGVVAELFVVAPLRDLGDRFGAQSVGFQPGFGEALIGLGGVGVAVMFRLVSVGWFPEVPALADVGA